LLCELYTTPREYVPVNGCFNVHQMIHAGQEVLGLAGLGGGMVRGGVIDAETKRRREKQEPTIQGFSLCVFLCDSASLRR
jgi:hypothetical protein